MKTLITLLSFIALAVQAQSALLTWGPVTNSQYKVYFSTNKNLSMPWSLIASPTTNNAVVSEVAGATNYFYVTSWYMDGTNIVESTPSDIAFHPRQPANVKLASSPSSDTLTFSANPSSDGVITYTVVGSIDKSIPVNLWTVMGSVTGSPITVTGVYTSGTKNYYAIYSTNLTGMSPYSPMVTRTPGPKSLFLTP